MWPWPVDLEPELLPPPVARSSQTDVDDARVRTLPERLASLALKGIKRLASRWLSDEVGQGEPLAAPRIDETELVCLRLSTPADFEASTEAVQRLLLSLPNSQVPMTWELQADHSSLSTWLVVREPERRQSMQQLAAHLPALACQELEDALLPRWLANNQDTLILDFALASEFCRPLVQPRGFSPDPLIGLYASLADLDEGESVVLQCSFQRCASPWPQAVGRALITESGQPLFEDVQDMLELAVEKFDSASFACALRVAIESRDQGRRWQIAQGVWRGLAPLERTGSNRLIPVHPGHYPTEALYDDFLLRQSRRSGFILSASELAGLVHPPDRSVRREKLLRVSSNTRQAPAVVQAGDLILGRNSHAGTTTEVALPERLRSRHMHLIGASGTGKSTLILQMALQDLAAGRGLCVIDPHGDLVDDLLARMPRERLDDLVLIDPADPERCVSFNVLEAKTDLEKQLLSSDLVASFRRLSTSWGDRMTSVLGNAILAFLESSRSGSLIDLRRFLVEPAFRADFLTTVADEEVRYFWEKEFPLLSGRPQAPLLTRLDTFLRNRLVRHLVAQRRSSFNLRELMDSNKVLLVRLSQGAIGEENASLLGALLVSRLQQAAQSRQELDPRQRSLFTLYLDEFQNYLTPSMSAILSGGRKYGLSLVLAHQDLSQLGRGSEGLLGAAISNPATRVCFRLGDSDAKKLAEGFAHFEAADLQRLGVGEALCRVERSDQDFNLETAALERAGSEELTSHAQAARKHSLANFGRLRSEISEEMAQATRNRQGDTKDAQTQASSKAKPTPEQASESPAPVEHKLPQPVRAEPPPKTSPPEPPKPGRGGNLHQYWQRVIAECAKSLGWKASREAHLETGGAADVLIEKGARKIAVEIAISGDANRELGNVRKCLEAGATSVLCLVASDTTRERLAQLLDGKLKGQTRAAVQIHTPESGLQALPGVLGSAPKEAKATLRGYVVRTKAEAPESTASAGAVSEFLKTLWKEQDSRKAD